MYNGVYTSEQYAYVHDTLIKWLNHKVNGNSLGLCLNEKGIKSVAIYGINDFGKMVYDDVKQNVSVIAFVDKKAESAELVIDGKKVISPSDAVKLPDDCYILITPEYFFREISDNLIKCGVTDERIISIAMVVA